MKHLPITSSIDARGIHIPAGWEARVPQVTPDAETIRAYASYFQRQGLRPAEAEQAVHEMVQEVFEGGWMMKLRLSLARWAEIYENRFGTMEGFRPEVMQQAFVPGENTGRAGKAYVNSMLREMRDDVRSQD